MSNRPLLLKGATLIDGVSPRPRENATLLIRNGRIAAVGTGDSVGLPEGARVVDLAEKWIIPGLIDMHCHIKEHYAPHWVAAGVTTVRNTAGSLRELHDLRTAPSDAPTPRVFSAGRIIDAPPGLWGPSSPWSFNAASAEEIRAEVRAQVEEGADLIKLFGTLPADVAQAAVEEASAHGIPVSFDLLYHPSLDIRQAVRMGVKWSEHASGFAQVLWPGFHLRSPREVWDGIDLEQERYPELDALCEELVDRGLMICPTMTILEQELLYPDYWWPDHPVTTQIATTNPAVLDEWKARAGYGGLWRGARLSRFNQTTARAFKRAGGVVVAGTDTPAGLFTPPGVTLHREMELLVRNGWSNLEAIQAATSVAAGAMGRSDLGVIRPGAVADLVVLDADPLADIRNTLTTHRVVKGGRLYTQEEILATAPADFEAHNKAKMAQVMAEFERTGR